MRTTHGLPCAWELSKYVVGSIPLETVHIFWCRLSFSNLGLCEAEVTIIEEMEIILKQFELLDVSGKVHLKTKLREIAYLDLNSMCPPLEKDSIENIIDVKVDGNCGYLAIAALLGMGEESWSLVHNYLHKELTSWSEEYINLLGDIKRFEELKRSLLVDGLSMVTTDKWMNITDMGYVIISRHNMIIVSLSQQQSMTFFPLRSQPPPNSFVHRLICIGHVYENHFVQVIA
ncbi:hypothetical protein GmHk_04G011087 [Glycine max]|nr:hypothetical protein GmHk_04G011087 [Glycine max]